MAAHDYWIGRCQLAARSPEARRWEEDADEALTVVVVLAVSEEEMRNLLLERLRQDGLELIWLDAVQTLTQRFRQEGMSQTLVELANGTTPRMPVAYGEMTPILPEPVAAAAEAPRDVPAVVSYDEVAWADLFVADRPPLWAVIDGVNCRDAMERLTRAEVQSCCLYATTDAATRAIAPWLVRIEPDSEVREWLESLPQDQHWGILLQSRATMKQLRAHLRKFTMLWTPANDQAPVYFRFYDPRVAVDMTQALEPWKLAAFMAPCEALVVSLSPLMVLPGGVEPAELPDFSAAIDDFQGRLMRLVPRELCQHIETNARGFSISQAEFDRFGDLQRMKASRKLARDLMEQYASMSPEEVLAAVEAAGRLGRRHAMTSKQQVVTLARCILEFGQDFPRGYEDVGRVLGDTSMLAWQRKKIIEEWIPRGRLRRDFLKRQPARFGEFPDAWDEKDNQQGIAE